MSVEEAAAKKIRMTKLRHAILASVEVAGVITLSMMAPNVLSLVGKVQKRRNERLKSAVQRLKEKGLLQIGRDGIRLTDAGEKYIRLYSAQKPSRWDRKWRIVIFDIPERRRTYRLALRQNLETIGFLRLQNSVWVYPYDCEELVVLLKNDYRLGKEVLYIVANTIEQEATIKRHFNL